MVSADELFDSANPMASDLRAGLATVALNQTVKFRLYGRVVLPIDGYVFWIRAPLLKQKQFQPGGLVTAAQISEEDMDPCEIDQKCSLHYTADVRQEEGETYTANRVVFTTNEEVAELNDVAPGMMWVGEFNGLRFGFSSFSMRYVQAGLWHYAGFALYADMGPQLVDDSRLFSSAQVVSNSLPAWLQISAYQPAWAFWGPLPQLYPSDLTPLNEPPPYGAVHVAPESTHGLASAPTIDPATSTHTQLCAETVKITLWGNRNDMALDFVDAVYRYSEDTGNIGIMNVPVIRDEKRTQAEMRVIAMKKSVEFEVSYLQHRMRTVATKVIRAATPNLYVDGVLVPPPEPPAPPS